MNIEARTLWTTLAAVLVAAVAIVTLSAQAQEEPPARPDRQGHARGIGCGFGPGPGLARLNLTDEQRQQIRAIMQEARESNQAAQKTAGDLQRELRAAVFADTPDQAKIDELKAAIGEAQAEGLNTRIAVELKIAQVLTPEQRTQAREAPGPRGGRGIRR